MANSKDTLPDQKRTGVHQSREIYDLVRGFIGLLTPEGNLLDANQSALDFIGCDLDEVVGRPFWETPWWRACPKAREAVQDAIQSAASGEASRFEAQICGKNNEIIVIDFSLTPIFNDDGTVVSLIPEGHDITDIKNAENALQESEAHLRLANEAAEMGTWNWNLTNNQLHWSDRQFELFDVPKSKGPIHIETALANIHPDDLDRLLTANRISVEEDVPFREEFRVIHRSGEVRWLLGQGNPLHHGKEGKPSSMIGVNYDISDRKTLELEIAQSNLELEVRVSDRTRALEQEMRQRQKAERALAHSQRFELIGQLAGGVAHDFNNLLAVIGGNLELAAMRTADEQIIELLNDAREAVETGASVNRRLLSFARQRELEPVALDVNDRIIKARRLLERTLGEKIVLETRLSSELCEARLDPGELDSAILNLVLNARDAMPSGGTLVISTRNYILDDEEVESFPEAQTREYVQVSISDTGVGMAPDVVAKALTPYFTTKLRGKGSGLGLSSVFGFATQSGGFVRIKSEEGEGTIVQIYLPHSATPSGAKMLDDPKTDLLLGQGELILLVEDEEKVRQITHKRLIELGYNVVEATTAAEGTAVLESNHTISLVFSDVRMPGATSGYDLAKWTLENREDVGVLLTSGYNDLSAEEHQNVNLLAKPYSLRILAFALRNALPAPRDR
jgi:PAS domain S-box-containing protein